MKTLVKTVVLIFLGFVPGTLANARADSNEIIPGESIGQTHLGRHGRFYLDKLPKPDAQDAAMGKYRAVWISRRDNSRIDTLFIYYRANAPRDTAPASGFTIELIRVTSSWYQTPDGLTTGDTFAQIRDHFPNLSPTESNRNLYNDSEHGIAFEFAEGISPDSPCTAIIVHRPWDSGKLSEASAWEVNSLLKAEGLW